MGMQLVDLPVEDIFLIKLEHLSTIRPWHAEGARIHPCPQYTELLSFLTKPPSERNRQRILSVSTGTADPTPNTAFLLPLSYPLNYYFPLLFSH